MNKKVLGVLLVVSLLVVGGAIAASIYNQTGSNSSKTTADSSQHNDQDVTFAQMMIPHHEQAIEMATLAETRASNPEVKQLAAEIKGAQDPEIATMRGWLKSWGKTDDIPLSTDPGHGGHDQGASVSGMMTGEDMSKLQAASGAEFDKMFMTMMILHHQGAIDMARVEQSTGQYGPAKELAGKVISAQAAEIKTMNRLLGK